MGILSFLDGDGCTLSLSLESPSASAGSAVRGQVTLRGGERKQRAEQVSLRLQCRTLRKAEKGHLESSYAEVLPATSISGPLEIEPGKQTEVPFQFVLPRDASPSGDRVIYELSAEADVRGEADPDAHVTLLVSPFVESALETSVSMKAVLVRPPRIRWPATCPNCLAPFEPATTARDSCPCAYCRVVVRGEVEAG